MTTHSRLAPSDSARWFNCPGSIILQESLGVVEQGSSEAADEGTAAHLLGEICYQEQADPFEYLGETLEGVVVTEDMAEAVTVWLDFLATLPKGKVEHKTSLSHIIPDPEAAGHIDYHAYSKRKQTLYVADYKHGQGVFVEVKNNTQLILYALGVLNELLERGKKVEYIKTYIVQPRCFRSGSKVIRKATYTRQELESWQSKLSTVARIIYRSPHRAQLKAGDKQCRWCACMARCPEAAQRAFGDIPEQYVVPSNNDELSSFLKREKYIYQFIAAIRQEALRAIMAGEEIDGYKVVRTTKHRQWVNSTDAEHTLSQIFPEDVYAPRSLISPSKADQLTKQTGILDHLMFIPQGDLCLAEAEDRREALSFSNPFLEN